jgi:hypothetical protein
MRCQEQHPACAPGTKRPQRLFEFMPDDGTCAQRRCRGSFSPQEKCSTQRRARYSPCDCTRCALIASRACAEVALSSTKTTEAAQRPRQGCTEAADLQCNVHVLREIQTRPTVTPQRHRGPSRGTRQLAHMRLVAASIAHAACRLHAQRRMSRNSRRAVRGGGLTSLSLLLPSLPLT